MLAIAGAVLINAACVLIASTQDTLTHYVLARFLLFIGFGLMGADIQARIREFIRKARANRQSQV